MARVPAFQAGCCEFESRLPLFSYLYKGIRSFMNFDNLVVNADKVDKVFATFKVSMFVGVIINIILIILLFKLTDIAINKLKTKFITKDNAATIGHIFIILDRVIKSIIVFFLVASFLQSQGYSLTSLIAGFGITGLAVGLQHNRQLHQCLEL